MANILLISCNITTEPYPVYPLGVNMIAETLKSAGHHVILKDLLFENESIDIIVEYTKNISLDVIGLSLRNIDNVNFNFSCSYIDNYKNIINALRKVSSAPIVLGGSAYTMFPVQMLKELKADYGIVGEGEQSVCELVALLELGKKPKNQIIKNCRYYPAEKIHIKALNRDLAQYYLNNGGMLNIQTKRGCPHRCAYCSYPHLEGKQYRFRPAVNVVDEIEMMIKEYRMDYFSITDSVFNDAAGNYLEIARELICRKIKVPWMCFLRPAEFTHEEAELLKESGLSSVEWGTDCSTDTTLKAMQKDFNWNFVMKSNNLFASLNISNSHFIIFGGPGETEKTIDEGLKNISQLNNCVVFASTGIRIFPNTSIYTQALAEKIITPEQNLLEPVFYFSSKVEQKVMHEKIINGFKGRLDRIYPDGMQFERINAFHKLGYRGPIWDFILKRGSTRKRR